ncbi:MAG: methionine--tRNA ligase [Clostridiales bacterium]|nr:methionine--tRNA ligase [Clostridiales bacterium]
MDILIAGAWPYANGPLHIGHLAALLPGDVLARYHRAKGDRVVYVSGSDCHGTPVSLRARQEGRPPRQVSDDFHHSFERDFARLGFSYDGYGQTSSAEHGQFVRDFHRRLYRSPYITEQVLPQAWCPACGSWLTDRYIAGNCPRCGQTARGDQCDACGRVSEPEELLSPRCTLCGGTPVFRRRRHLFLDLPALREPLDALLAGSPHWRKNAAAITRRYLGEGLRKRAVTRCLDWGVEVPREGYDDRRIYIWAENVLGYLSVSEAVCRRTGGDFSHLWDPGAADVRHYYLHGKDNVPFHTLILPALLLAEGGQWRLPDRVFSSEHLTLLGRKISTSQNWAVWAADACDRYPADTLRYFLLACGPEKQDADFRHLELAQRHNSDLAGAYGNFLHRTLAFLERYHGGKVPQGTPESNIVNTFNCLYDTIGGYIEAGEFRRALRSLFDAVRTANRYFDSREPWCTRETAPSAYEDTLSTCVQLAANLSNLLRPFLPFSSEKAAGWLGLNGRWEPQVVPGGHPLPPIEVLFARLDIPSAERLDAALLS